MKTIELPNGITGFEPMPYGYRRWNNTVWCAIHVDVYNRHLVKIEKMHRDGYDTQRLINGLYNLANGFDNLDK